MRNGTKNGEADPQPIPKFAPLFAFDVGQPAVDDEGQGRQYIQKIVFKHVADADQGQGGGRQFLPKALVNVRKDRDDFDQEENCDRDGHGGHDDGVHHRRLYFLAQPGGAFQIGRKAGKNLRQQTAALTRPDHANIKAVEDFGMFLQRFRKTIASLNPGANVFEGVAHDLVGGLLDQRLQGLDHGQTGVDHGGQLAGENDEVGQRHFATGGFSFFADFFLNRDDEEIAVEQGGNGGLLGLCFEGVADLSPAPGLARYIGKRRHILKQTSAIPARTLVGSRLRAIGWLRRYGASRTIVYLLHLLAR